MKTIALCLAFAALAGPAAAQEDVRIPNGIDLSRLKKIEAQYAAGGEVKKSQKLMVSAQMTSIDTKDAHMLFPVRAGKSVGTSEQLRQRFETAISATNRFDLRSQRQTDILEGIVVEGMITAATQDLEDYKAFLKSVTTVRLSVQVKDLETGEVLRSKNLSAVYGSEDGEGTIITNRNELKFGRGGCEGSHVCQNLENDYEKALTEVFESLAAFIEKTFRPVAKVYDVDGDSITMLGSVKHGFNPEEELIVFRAKTVTNEAGKPLPPVVKPVAVVKCSVGDTLSCQVVKKGRNGDVQNGDYAVPTDKMLRLHES
jgi:hypothetical protein